VGVQIPPLAPPGLSDEGGDLVGFLAEKPDSEIFPSLKWHTNASFESIV
jgi:hypothetical protein